MYLDGTQHHIRDVTALHLTSLDKGQVTQPWQGAGALMDNGRGKLEPFVLTAGRRSRYTVQTVTGLDVVPEAGFEQIEIVQASPERQRAEDNPSLALGAGQAPDGEPRS
jgi:hypothetical protein